MNDDLTMNRLTVVDHPGLDAKCSDSSYGHQFDKGDLADAQTRDAWVGSFLYCKSCGHVRELVYDRHE